MAKVQSIVCDGCGKVKGESNHWWWVAWDVNGEPQLFILPSGKEWEEHWDHVFDLCGQACVIAKLSEWMNPKQVEQPKVGGSYQRATSVVAERSEEEIKSIQRALSDAPVEIKSPVEAYYIKPTCPRCPHPAEGHTFKSYTGRTCELCNCEWLPPQVPQPTK